PSYRQNTQRTFLWGVLMTGAYGVLQYLIAPEWDKFWLINVKATAFGTPEPFGIRVFSTMNSPQPFSLVMMTGLLLLFNSKGSLRFPASGVGYLSFLLTLARAAWLGWSVGLLTLLNSLKARLQMRLIITILIMALFVIPLATIEPFSGVISSRLQTLSSTQNDVSYQARSEGYGELFGLALSELLGKGVGHVINSDSLGSNDSGILTLLFSLGWLGTIPYLGGLILLLFSVFQSSEGRFDPFMSAARAISLGVFVQLGLGSVMLGLIGVLLWGFLGMAMAAHKYYQHQHNT
ncbi:MAG: O-antigen ligase domain-containing protein, partial [Coleofasciculus sp. S288]|nr:O-antigen ligase domain-containing protein [Coleofasciculus sp. S288]